MIHDPFQGFQTDAPQAQLFMPVLVGSQGILAVVEMDGLQPVQPQDPVESFQHSVQMGGDIIASVPHMAGIQADPYFFRQFQPVDDGPELFKGPPHFCVPFPAMVSKSRVVCSARGSTALRQAAMSWMPVSAP